MESGARGSERPPPAEPRPAAGATQRLLVFVLNGRPLAVPLGAVEAIVRRPAQLTRVPGAPPEVAGAMARRGEVIPVLRLDDAVDRWVLVLKLSAGPLGLALSAAPRTLVAASDRLAPAETASPLLPRQAVLEDGAWVGVIDPQAHELTLAAIIAALADAEGG